MYRALNRLRRQDKVYDEDRYNEGKPANGVIINISWEDREITVKFNDDPLVVVYDFSDFEGMWEDSFDGIWWLQ